jgi:hypothetical protein
LLDKRIFVQRHAGLPVFLFSGDCR